MRYSGGLAMAFHAAMCMCTACHARPACCAHAEGCTREAGGPPCPSVLHTRRPARALERALQWAGRIPDELMTELNLCLCVAFGGARACDCMRAWRHFSHRQAVLRWTTCKMQLLVRVLMAFQQVSCNVFGAYAGGRSGRFEAKYADCLYLTNMETRTAARVSRLRKFLMCGLQHCYWS